MRHIGDCCPNGALLLQHFNGVLDVWQRATRAKVDQAEKTSATFYCFSLLMHFEMYSEMHQTPRCHLCSDSS